MLVNSFFKKAVTNEKTEDLFSQPGSSDDLFVV